MEPETRPEQPWSQPDQAALQQTAQQLQPGTEPGPEPRDHMTPTSEFGPSADAFGPPAGPPVAAPSHAMPAVPLIGMTAPSGLQMKHRSPLGVWILSIITFGIYGLVYWYKIHAELARLDPRQKISPVFELIPAWRLSFTTALPIMSIFRLAGKIGAAQAAVAQTAACS